MLWLEKNEEKATASDDIQDLSLRINCQALPIDHAMGLRDALLQRLPWLIQEPNAAIHSIHVASSGNGWSRPDSNEDQWLRPSRRTRLYLRLPKHRMEAARDLVGQSLDLYGTSVTIGKAELRPLVTTTTVFARSVCGDCVEDEAAFTRDLVETLKWRGIQITKIMYGLAHYIRFPSLDTQAGPDPRLEPGIEQSASNPENTHYRMARSVLISDLDPKDAIALQQQGIGDDLLMGCGIFLPHKSLAAVGHSQDDD